MASPAFRFGSISAESLSAFSVKAPVKNNVSASKNSISQFNEWCIDKKLDVDLSRISDVELVAILSKFIAEA